MFRGGYWRWADVHAESSLQQERRVCDDVDALVVLRDVDDDFEEQRGQRNSRSEAEVREDRDDCGAC